MISIDILTSFDFFEANNKWKDACQFSLKVTFSIQTTHWFRRARIAHFFKLQFKYLRPSGGKHVLKDTIWDAWHFDFKSLGAISYFLVAQMPACLSVSIIWHTGAGYYLLWEHSVQTLLTPHKFNPLESFLQHSANSKTISFENTRCKARCKLFDVSAISCNNAKLVTAGDSNSD